jgi:nitroreductase
VVRRITGELVGLAERAAAEAGKLLGNARRALRHAEVKAAELAAVPDEVLTTTRSVRKRLDLTRSVPMQLVRECLQLALQAPTGGNSQSWHWVVVTDPQLRATIGDYYRRSFARSRESASYAGRLGDGSGSRRAVQARVASSAEYLAERMGEVPVHVIACIEAGEELPAAN